MKTGIHPEYFTDAVITCANCKFEFKTGATSKELQTEVCSQCHPFYTGKKVVIDSEGRIDKFSKKLEGAQTRKKKKVRKKTTIEDKFNLQLSKDVEKEKVKEEKEAAKRAAKRTANAAKASAEAELAKAVPAEVAAE